MRGSPEDETVATSSTIASAARPAASRDASSFEHTVAAGDATQLDPSGGLAHRRHSLEIARGALIGRFVVLTKLGEGGMGTVYAAYDPELDRKVAIKLLHETIGAARLARGRRSRSPDSHTPTSSRSTTSGATGDACGWRWSTSTARPLEHV